MPAPEFSHRYQFAVLWLAVTDSVGRVVHDAQGQVKVSQPVQVNVRWDGSSSEQVDPQGNKVAVDATAIVVQDVPIGSFMWLGKIMDLPGTGLVPATDTMQVKTANTTKDVKNRFTFRKVGLMRLKDALPTVTS